MAIIRAGSEKEAYRKLYDRLFISADEGENLLRELQIIDNNSLEELEEAMASITKDFCIKETMQIDCDVI
jgi:hypothetical protein